MINSGQEFSFGVTYDRDDLFVAAEVYDNSGASPVLLARVPMSNYSGNSYQGKYTQNTPTSLLIQKSVYTDGTYAVRDTNYSQADEAQQVVLSSIGSSGGPSGVVGVVQVSGPIVGVVPDSTLIGIVG